MIKIISTVLILSFFAFGCKKDNGSSNDDSLTVYTLTATKVNRVSINVETETSNNTRILEKRGVCYSTLNSTPTLIDSVTSDSAKWGRLISKIDNLNTSSKYFIRAYVKTTSNVIYGNTLIYKTPTLLKDSNYYALLYGGDSRNYYRDRVKVKSDTLDIKLYYQKTDSFTILRYCSTNLPYNYITSDNKWYKFNRIGNNGYLYLLVNKNITYDNESAFKINMSNLSYDDAYLTPLVQIGCQTMIE